VPHSKPRAFSPNEAFDLLPHACGMLVACRFNHIKTLLETTCSHLEQLNQRVEIDSPLFTWSGQLNSSCPICLENFRPGQQDDGPISTLPLLTAQRDIVKTPCAHLFHRECLATWCKNHIDCPLCRQPIFPSA